METEIVRFILPFSTVNAKLCTAIYTELNLLANRLFWCSNRNFSFSNFLSFLMHRQLAITVPISHCTLRLLLDLKMSIPSQTDGGLIDLHCVNGK